MDKKTDNLAFAIDIKYEEFKQRSYFYFCSLTLDELIQTKTNFLSQEELLKFATIVNQKRKHSYLLGRYAVKKLLLIFFPKININELSIENGIFGHPILKSFTNFDISISHTEDVAAVIMFDNKTPMAIDVESVKNRKINAIKSILTEVEKKLIEDFFPQNIDNLYIQFWTAKEALSKALKCGMTVPFDLFEIKNIKAYKNHNILYFKNFSIYEALAFAIEDKIISFVYPEKGTVEFVDS